MTDDITKYSNPKVVYELAEAYGIPRENITISTRKGKKYMVIIPDGPRKGQIQHFGALGYEDFTKHRNPVRRARYIARASNLPGKWRDDKYSANNLSIHLLWPAF